MKINPRDLCQVDLCVRDRRRSLQFYEDVFGWRAAPAEVHGMTFLDVPEDCPWGIALVDEPTLPAGGTGRTVLYFACDDPALVHSRVAAAGGRPGPGPVRVPGYGKVWRFEDPDGLAFGVYQAESGEPVSRLRSDRPDD